MKKILACGLGGGMDIINAATLYFAARNEGNTAVLGSSRPAPLSSMSDHVPFAECGALVSKDTAINYYPQTGPKRYCEPRVASLIGEPVLYLSRKYAGEDNTKKLSDAIRKARSEFGITHMFFIDGGGDSLIFTPQDATAATEHSDPFQGGDAKMLEALVGMDNAYMGVIAAGLDISEFAFKRNVELMKARGVYCGRVNLRTGEKQDYRLEGILNFTDGFLEQYFRLAENILVLQESDIENPERTMSHTGVVTYDALRGNFGRRRTYLWEDQAGKDGVEVKPEHCWMYFFNAAKVHQIKKDLSRAESKKPKPRQLPSMASRAKK